MPERRHLRLKQTAQRLREAVRSRPWRERARVPLDRMQAEVDFGDDAQSAEAAGHELVQIVAGDIFHDLAAGLCDRAVGKDQGHADDEIAQAAVLQSQRAAVVGGDDTADGGALGP